MGPHLAHVREARPGWLHHNDFYVSAVPPIIPTIFAAWYFELSRQVCCWVILLVCYGENSKRCSAFKEQQPARFHPSLDVLFCASRFYSCENGKSCGSQCSRREGARSNPCEELEGLLGVLSGVLDACCPVPVPPQRTFSNFRVRTNCFLFKK